MKIEKATQQELVHSLTVTMSPLEIEERIKKELEILGKNVQIDGFRKGKVPLSLLTKKFSDRALSEVLRKAPEELVYFALQDKKLKPALQPEVAMDAFQEGKPLQGVITVEALPVIDEVKVEGLKLTKITEKVLDEEKARFKKSLKSQLIRREKAKPGSSLKKGDSVLLKCEIIGKSGEILGDYKAPILEYPIGTDAFGPKFEKELDKIKVGDKFELSGILPAGFKGSKEPQDVVVRGEYQSHDVFIEPSDEELITYLGLKDAAGLDEFVSDKLIKVNGEKADQYLKRQILDQLSQTHNFLVPPGMVQLELKTIWNEFLESSKDPSSEEAVLLKAKSKEDILKEYEDIAQRRVLLGLLLAEVGNRQGIKIAGDELAHAIYSYARQFPGEEEKVLDFYRKNPNQTAHIQAQIYEGKVIEYIISKAQITQKEEPVGTLDKLLSEEDSTDGSSGKEKKRVKGKPGKASSVKNSEAGTSAKEKSKK